MEERTTENKARRRLAITLFSSAGFISAPSSWTKPIINAVMLPAHAQTSCSSIDVIGQWQFTDQNSTTFTIEFLTESSLIFNGAATPDAWFRSSDGVLNLDLSPPQAPTRVTITQSAGCVASELTVISITPIFSGITPPAVGIRI